MPNKHYMSVIRIRVAAIIQRNDEVLLVEHCKNGKQYWLLPGGGLEYNESVTDCVRRELKEETNLDIEVQDLAFSSETIAPDFSRHVLHLVFFAQAIGGTLKIGDEERLLQTKYVKIADLDKLIMHPPIAQELQKALSSTERGFAIKHLGALWRD